TTKSSMPSCRSRIAMPRPAKPAPTMATCTCGIGNATRPPFGYPGRSPSPCRFIDRSPTLRQILAASQLEQVLYPSRSQGVVGVSHPPSTYLESSMRLRGHKAALHLYPKDVMTAQSLIPLTACQRDVWAASGSGATPRSGATPPRCDERIGFGARQDN